MRWLSRCVNKMENTLAIKLMKEEYIMRYLVYIAIIFISFSHISAQKIEAVDLALPSGLKWGNMNVGAKSPTEYGDYFAWGEIKTKMYYGQYSKYKHYDDKSFSKYNYVNYRGSVVDKILQLNYEDDVAVQRLGKGWRMPTEAEVKELLDTCNCVWTVVDSCGTRGYLVQSKRNIGKTIFLPLTGRIDYGVVRQFPATQGNYWTSTLVEENFVGTEKQDSLGKDYVRKALCLKINSDESPVIEYVSRKVGCVVRPVRK